MLVIHICGLQMNFSSCSVIIGVKNLILGNLSLEKVKIVYINKRNDEIRPTCSADRGVVWNSCKSNMSVSRYSSMGSKTTAINYLKKACLEAAMPSTWIHFNGGSGHMCLGSSNPLWVTLTYDIWTEYKTKNFFFSFSSVVVVKDMLYTHPFECSNTVTAI